MHVKFLDSQTWKTISVSKNKNEKFDIVIDKVRRRNEDNKRIIEPQVIIEVKVFPIDFTDQQHRVHFKHVINDDLRKLSEVKCDNKFELLFDERGYLEGKYSGNKRIEVINKDRDEKTPETKIFVITQKYESIKI